MTDKKRGSKGSKGSKRGSMKWASIVILLLRVGLAMTDDAKVDIHLNMNFDFSRNQITVVTPEPALRSGTVGSPPFI